ncbi:RluA family pseudouridine synthase [Lactobacillus sp. ESL0791]|uniref:RluA family pseudouridine synthase n=1 Tax=Lactobacillus sp. ESL0791 TaxID=2983234 RepID=UPI0035ABEDA6
MTLFKLMVEAKSPKNLGAFLLKSGFSRRAINNAKNRQGMILVNHRRRYTGYELKTGDEVIFVTGREKKNQWLKPSVKPIKIVRETANYVVVNKEAGVLSIPSRYEDDDAVVNRLLFYFGDQVEKLKPHVITRLDKDTSGLVLVGKNAITHAMFSKIPKQDFTKKYHAVVHGNFADNELSGVVRAPIGKRDASVVRCIRPEGRPAVTEYRVLEQTAGASLVELHLLTGRTHQIRVHMQYIGHPLFGDKLYGASDAFARQALNCCYLAFPDPFASKQKTKITVEDPQDMKKLWDSLKK